MFQEMTVRKAMVHDSKGVVYPVPDGEVRRVFVHTSPVQPGQLLSTPQGIWKVKCSPRSESVLQPEKRMANFKEECESQQDLAAAGVGANPKPWSPPKE